MHIRIFSTITGHSDFPKEVLLLILFGKSFLNSYILKELCKAFAGHKVMIVQTCL